MLKGKRIYLILFFLVLLITALSQTIPWRGVEGPPFPPSSKLGRLPVYALASLLRMAAAYLLALAFSLPFGYYAAVKPRLGKVLLPILDILQSIPVLGFFPVAITVFVSLGGGGRIGVEFAAIFLIFTSQAWNMAYGVYESTSSVPHDSVEAVRAFGLSPSQTYRRLFLPASIPKLVYNSMLSWAGGWYFLIACEIISVGPVSHNLPGLGAFLVQTVEAGQYMGTAIGLSVQVSIIVLMDILLWRPLLDWSTRFRYELSASSLSVSSSKQWAGLGLIPLELRIGMRRRFASSFRFVSAGLGTIADATMYRMKGVRSAGPVLWRVLGYLFLGAIGLGIAVSIYEIYQAISRPWPAEALELPGAMALSTGRMLVAYLLALSWTIPLAVWAGSSPRVGRFVRPMAQIGASIPATALFPIIVVLVIKFLGAMDLASILLILTGMQWYILFNIMAGVASVPQDLKEATRSLNLSKWQTFKALTFPAMIPALITGSVTGWGGGWNALIISEYMTYSGETYWVQGIGSMLDRATFDMGNVTLMVLTLTVMVGVIVTINRFVWRRLYNWAVDRFRLDL